MKEVPYEAPEFTLQDGDSVTITIDPIGALTNPVERIEV